MGRALVMSDLPALREMGIEGETILYYRPGSVGDLADTCAPLVRDPLQRQLLGENARQWVLRERTWEQTLGRLPDAYACAERELAASNH